MAVSCLISREQAAADYQGARGVMIPVYDAAQREALAVVKLGQVQRGYRKLGFFKVKLCPLVTAEEVQLEIRQPNGGDQIWAQFCKSLRGVSGGLPLELRNVTVRFPNEPLPRLQAKALRLGAAEDGPVLAWDHVVIHAAAGQCSVAQALLPVAACAGSLEWQSGNLRLDYDIFADRFTTNSIPSDSQPTE